jgi:choline dehydrogenase-like flavoprotein
VHYDYVIVGAGSAGATLAGRLSQNPALQIALVEAGTDWRAADAPAALRSPNPSLIINAPQYAHLRWETLQARRTRLQTPRLYWRGRGLGGSSAINGQIAIRPMPDDFERWAAAGCSGWSFSDVLPYFRRLETDLRYGALDYHGDSGPIPIYRAPQSLWGPVDLALGEAGVDLGYGWAADHNAPGALGVSPYAINSLHGARVTTNDAYLEPQRGRNNLTVLCEASVERVLFDSDCAIGVRCSVGGEARDIRAGEVILAAGAVHSPAILLRSGIGPPEHLRALEIDVRCALPVGENFQDHPIAALPIVLQAQYSPPPEFRHTNCCVRYSSGHPDCGAGDMMIVAMNRLGDGLGRNTRAPTQNFGLVGVWVNQCFSRGSVRLASADPLAQPIIEENMLDDSRDLTRIRDGVRRLCEIVRQPGFGAIAEFITTGPTGDAPASLDSDAAIDAWVLHTAGDAQHATSSCRMGAPDDPASVVDPACRVLGVRGLRVIDASVMPSVPTANTHLATVMIAECMADRLGSDTYPTPR